MGIRRSNPYDMYNTISSNNGNPSNTSLPTLNTLNISSITTYSANSGGNITDEGGSLVTQKGVCWSVIAIHPLY